MTVFELIQYLDCAAPDQEVMVTSPDGSQFGHIEKVYWSDEPDGNSVIALRVEDRPSAIRKQMRDV